MRPLSASQALVPAFRRTWELLYRPFDWNHHLRISVAAVFTSAFVVNSRYTLSGETAIGFFSIPGRYRQTGAFSILTIVAGLLVLDLAILLFYYRARLRFAIFHSIANPSRSLSAGFAHYERQAVKFVRAKAVVWLLIAGLVLAIALIALLAVFSVRTLRAPDGKYDAGVFLILFFPAAGFAALVVTVALWAQIALHDFILPHIALENSSLREAWRSVRKKIGADREAFFSYFLLRMLILIVAGPVLAGLAFVLLWPLFWVLGASSTGYSTLLDEATGLLGAARIALTILFSVLAALLGVGGSALMGGPLIIFLRAHALFFYGSRYPPLGQMLFQENASAAAAGSG